MAEINLDGYQCLYEIFGSNELTVPVLIRVGTVTRYELDPQLCENLQARLKEWWGKRDPDEQRRFW